MISFFQFQSPTAVELFSDFGKQFRQWEYRPCPIGGKHKTRHRKDADAPLQFFVNHNDRNEYIVWGTELAVHLDAIESLEREGFTGFCTRPARVTFIDGTTSDEYREFTVKGWAGVVRPESGMRLLDTCPVCLWKNYGPITDFSQVIEWDQWTGEDFFFVWPLTGHRLCTERAAKWLEASGLRSFRLGRGFDMLEKEKRSLSFGIPRGRLSEVIPENLAIKYGRPFGLE